MGSGGVGGTGSSISASIGTAFTLSYVGGGADNLMLSVDGAANVPLTVTFANINSGILVGLTVTGPANNESAPYSLVISPAAGGAALATMSGTFDSSAFNTANFSFTDFNTAHDAFVNNLTIVPEPSSLMLLAAGAGAAQFFRLRRKS